MEFEQFRAWVGREPSATGLISWIARARRVSPRDAAEVPSYYETIARLTGESRVGAAHDAVLRRGALDADGVQQLERRYRWLQQQTANNHRTTAAASRDSILAPEALARALPGLPTECVDRLFRSWGSADEDGSIRFRDACRVAALCCFGTDEELLRHTCRLFGGAEAETLDGDALCEMWRLFNWNGPTSSTLREDPGSKGESPHPGSKGESPPEYDSGEQFAQAALAASGKRTGQPLSYSEFAAWSAFTSPNRTAWFISGLRYIGFAGFGVMPRSPVAQRKVLDRLLRSARRHRDETKPEHRYLLERQWWLDFRNAVKPESVPEISNAGLIRPAGIFGEGHVGAHSRWRPRLKKGLERAQDFADVPETVWSLLVHWYGVKPGSSISRPVILNSNGKKEIELYPLSIKVMHYVRAGSGSQSGGGNLRDAKAELQERIVFWQTAEVSRGESVSAVVSGLMKTKKASRSKCRLWHFCPGQTLEKAVQLQDEAQTIFEAGIRNGSKVLFETQNGDQSWPSELFFISLRAKQERGAGAQSESVRSENEVSPQPAERVAGTTGLVNLGNTCFLNAVLQCLSSTEPLTSYFRGGIHLAEINQGNPLGFKGRAARRYGELVGQLWSGKTCVAPSAMQKSVSEMWPQFVFKQQHDSAELLTMLLDGLHEDVNRVLKAPYVERKDSDGRADCVVAREAWEGHLLRNRSIIVDLFQGQLKSTMRCKACDYVNVSFDPFTTLTLPLPTDSVMGVDVCVTWLGCRRPVVYCVEVPHDARFGDVRTQVAGRCGLSAESVVLVDYLGTAQERMINDDVKVRNSATRSIVHAYEIDPAALETAAPATVDEKTGPDQVQPDSAVAECREDGAPSVAPEQTPAASSTAVVSSAGDSLANEMTASSAAPRLPSPEADGGESSTATAGDQAVPKLLQSVKYVIPNHVFAVQRRVSLARNSLLIGEVNRTPYGSPIVIPENRCKTNAELHRFLWMHLSRFLPGDVSESVDAGDSPLPFELKRTKPGGTECFVCPWEHFCTGCKVPNDATEFTGGPDVAIAVDWSAETWHLYFDDSEISRRDVDPSVEEIKKKANREVNLQECLAAFTKEEELGEDNLWYCPKCKDHVKASKKLDIWACISLSLSPPRSASYIYGL